MNPKAKAAAGNQGSVDGGIEFLRKGSNRARVRLYPGMSDPEPADPVHMLAPMGTTTAIVITMISIMMGMMIIGLMS